MKKTSSLCLALLATVLFQQQLHAEDLINIEADTYCQPVQVYDFKNNQERIMDAYFGTKGTLSLDSNLVLMSLSPRHSTSSNDPSPVTIDGLKASLQQAPILIDTALNQTGGLISRPILQKMYGVKLLIEANESIAYEFQGCVPHKVNTFIAYTICTESSVN